jgi:hypothetical protein
MFASADVMNKLMKRKLLIAVVLIVVAAGAYTIWCKFYHEAPQPQWIVADEHNEFLYGAVDPEEAQGIPYWIWLVLPRLFPEYMPAPGGYASLGLPWEETLEMPAGFAKKTIGYVRVTGNCALCHASSLAAGSDGVSTVVVAPTEDATSIQPLLTFYRQCAQDQRFNANEILAEVDNAIKLSLFDELIYRYVLIPQTKKALLNPERMIFAPELLAHAGNPRAGFSVQRLKELADWMKAVRR